MPRQRTCLSELGSIYTYHGEYCAHFQFCNEANKKNDIYGPSRKTKQEAQEDLEQIRKAGAVGKDREEGLKIMGAEAQQIKITAKYQPCKWSVSRLWPKYGSPNSKGEDLWMPANQKQKRQDFCLGELPQSASFDQWPKSCQRTHPRSLAFTKTMTAR